MAGCGLLLLKRIVAFIVPENLEIVTFAFWKKDCIFAQLNIHSPCFLSSKGFHQITETFKTIPKNTMGRAFEARRGKKEKRWDWMSKTYTKYGREISIAVKQGGADPDSNPRLRLIIQNAKNANMPKDRIENAIKKASSKDESNFEEIAYEGYAPHGVAILVECATDNPTRTVAMVRMHFNRAEGSMGKSGSLDFIFQRKGVFELAAEGLNKDDLELELIDFGAEEVYEHEGKIVVQTSFTDFGAMQKALEERKISVLSAKAMRIPTTTVQVTDQQAEEILELVDKFEQEDDVQEVYHNMA